jgi:hypothetical protein
VCTHIQCRQVAVPWELLLGRQIHAHDRHRQHLVELLSLGSLHCCTYNHDRNWPMFILTFYGIDPCASITTGVKFAWWHNVIGAARSCRYDSETCFACLSMIHKIRNKGNPNCNSIISWVQQRKIHCIAPRK